MRQKITKAFLIVILMNVVIISGIYAATNIYIDDIESKAGEEVTVDVKIDGNTGFVGSQIILYYDTTKLKYISSSNGNVVDGKMAIISNNESTNNVKQVVVGTDINTNGNLMTIKFKVKDNVLDETIPLELKVQELKNDNGSETLVDVTHTVKSGNILLASNNNITNNDNDDTKPSDNKKDSITSYTSNDKVEVKKDESGNLSIKLKESTENKKIEYISSDENVATVDESGNITPLAIGEFTITAMIDGKEVDKALINISDLEIIDSTNSDSFKIWNLIITIIIALVVIVAIVIFIIAKKRKIRRSNI